MTQRMTAKTFLLQPQELQKDIFEKEKRIFELRTLAEKCTSLLSPAAGGGHDDRKMENITVQIADLEDELAALTQIRDGQVLAVTEVLSRMSNTSYSLLLMERYIENKTVAAIARDHCYSERWTERMLRTAYEAYRRLYENLPKEGTAPLQPPG